MWEKKTPHWVKTNVNIDTNMWCQLNTQGAEKLLLSSSPSYYILPFFCKKEKKRMEIEMIQLSKKYLFWNIPHGYASITEMK